MIGLFGRLFLPVWLISVFSILAICFTPYNDSAVRAFLEPSAECSMPCWEGIRPGVTTIEEITQMLEENGWSRDSQFNYGMQFDTGLLTWRWRNPPSPLIESRRIGIAWIQNNVVQWMELPTRLTFGDIWLFFDHPLRGAIQPASVIPRRINHYASYDEQDQLQVRSTIFCPVHPKDFWQAHVDVLIGSLPVIALKDYRLPHWASCS